MFEDGRYSLAGRRHCARASELLGTCTAVMPRLTNPTRAPTRLDPIASQDHSDGSISTE